MVRKISNVTIENILRNGCKKKKYSRTEERGKAKTRYQAILKNCPTSPRKMRLVTDMISGMEVNKALDILKFSSKGSI